MKSSRGETDEPHAAQADFDAHQLLHVVAKDLSLVGPAVAIAVGQDQHAVAQSQIELRRPLRVGIALGDPQPAAAIPRHRHGILHVRLRGKHLCAKALGQAKSSGCSLRAQRQAIGIIAGIERRRELLCRAGRNRCEPTDERNKPKDARSQRFDSHRH